MSIEKFNEKIARLKTSQSSSPLSREELATVTVFSGSASFDKFMFTNPEDMYYAVNDLKDKIDETVTKSNTLNTTIDGGEF